MDVVAKLEIIEAGKVLDIYPDEGCVQYRVRGLRTGIEYLGCRHQITGCSPAMFDVVAIERCTQKDDIYAFLFSKERACEVSSAPA